jgi:RNA polymerase sigma-70 factor (ECF subfamily)
VTEKDPALSSASLEDVNDAAFLARLRDTGPAGRRAFNELVRATHGRLLGYVRRHLGSLEESQEVVQEVYLAAHKGLANFEGKSRLTTWLYSLAHHKVCDGIANRSRSRAVFRDVGDDTEGNTSASCAPSQSTEDDWSRVTPWGSSPDKVYARRAAEQWIPGAIASLGPPGCDVYHLRDVEGLTGEEVAAILGLSHAAVRVQLHRARADIVAWVRARMAGGKGGNA